MPTTSRRRALRDPLAAGEVVVTPSVIDGISAQSAKRIGHVAAYLTGGSAAVSGFGLRDIGRSP